MTSAIAAFNRSVVAASRSRELSCEACRRSVCWTLSSERLRGCTMLIVEVANVGGGRVAAGWGVGDAGGRHRPAVLADR
jgi:hypothetical protein